MEDLKTGDIIKFVGDDQAATVLREEILGRVDGILFTRSLYEGGSVSSINPPQLIEDLVTYGWEKE